MTSPPEVRNNTERNRYELLDGDRVIGVAEYRQVDEDTVLLPHTQIEAALRGNGLGALLVAATLDDMRAAGQKVIPHCWYVAEFIDTHPKYRDLVAA